jgi:aryl-alcohol dehydrogenase-like predicted oxidoreductase
MKKNQFGQTQLSVSAIGLGLAAAGRPGYFNLGHAEDLQQDHSVEAMKTRAHSLLDLAYARGVRYFDAARSYGRAEEFLGSWLAQLQAGNNDVIIGSKWGYTYTADWQVDVAVHEVKDHSLPLLQKQWAESQSMLGRRPDLYQIHSATLESNVLEKTEVLSELALIKSAGTFIGISVSGPRQSEVIDRALKIEIDGVRLFDCVQASWNIHEISATESLMKAHREGVGVIIKEALANGRLTSSNTRPEFAASSTVLNAQAERLGTTIDGISLAAVLAKPWVDVVLSGAATIPHLKSNLNAMSVELDQVAVESIARLVETPEHYWDYRSRLPWN